MPGAPIQLDAFFDLLCPDCQEVRRDPPPPHTHTHTHTKHATVSTSAKKSASHGRGAVSHVLSSPAQAYPTLEQVYEYYAAANNIQYYIHLFPLPFHHNACARALANAYLHCIICIRRVAGRAGRAWVMAMVRRYFAAQGAHVVFDKGGDVFSFIKGVSVCCMAVAVPMLVCVSVAVYMPICVRGIHRVLSRSYVWEPDELLEPSDGGHVAERGHRVHGDPRGGGHEPLRGDVRGGAERPERGLEHARVVEVRVHPRHVRHAHVHGQRRRCRRRPQLDARGLAAGATGGVSRAVYCPRARFSRGRARAAQVLDPLLAPPLKYYP